MTNNSTKRTLGKLYTAYLVRDVNARRFLNRKIYTGRQPGIWGRMGEAQIFYTEAQAQSCASNINRRRPGPFSAYFAEVVPIQLRGRGRRIDD
jgi:hypothetical protein